MTEGALLVSADGLLRARLVSPGVRVRPRKGYRKIPPRRFAALYLSGAKMSAIAAQFAATLQACKAMRRKLRLPPRPAHRPKGV